MVTLSRWDTLNIDREKELFLSKVKLMFHNPYWYLRLLPFVLMPKEECLNGNGSPVQPIHCLGQVFRMELSFGRGRGECSKEQRVLGQVDYSVWPSNDGHVPKPQNAQRQE